MNTPWLKQRPSDTTVAWLADGPRSWGQWRYAVEVLAKQLTVRRASAAALHTESAWTASIALAACWHLGMPVVLAPNGRRGTLAAWTESNHLLLGDDGELAIESSAGAPQSEFVPQAPIDEELLVICTSGTTGARKNLGKSIRQLLDEVDGLEAVFGANLGASRVLGSVSHQHIYGLLFRLLWPLRHGRAFVDRSVIDAHDASALLDGQDQVVLVHSPAYLDRAVHLQHLSALGSRCKAIFSSGGPLSHATAKLILETLEHAPIEIFGSSETGGVAWRQLTRTGESQHWRLLPGVRISLRGDVLVVQSPSTRGSAVETNDRARMEEQSTFQLLGRTDRTVKVFDERVSLDDVEQRLRDSDWVRRAIAVVSRQGSANRLAVIVELSEVGLAAFRENGRRYLIDTLRGQLTPFFRPSALPRQWRFVDKLSFDSQGKISLSHIEGLLKMQGPCPTPQVTAIRALEAGHWQIDFTVNPDLWCLRGHFPDMPVVAGVVQVHWIIAWVAQLCQRELRVKTLQNLKFKSVMRPEVNAVADLWIEDGRAEFLIRSGTTQYSSARIIFASHAVP